MKHILYLIKAMICRKLGRYQANGDMFTLKTSEGDYRAFNAPGTWQFKEGVGRGLRNWWITDKVTSSN